MICSVFICRHSYLAIERLNRFEWMNTEKARAAGENRQPLLLFCFN